MADVISSVEKYNNSESDKEEYTSLEYEEDCFYATGDSVNVTPSFDDVVTAEDCRELSFWTIDPDLCTELQLSDDSDVDFEIKFPEPQVPRPKFVILRSGNIVKNVRLHWKEVRKYFDKVKRRENYRRILKAIKMKTANDELVPEAEEVAGLTEEERAQQREIWQKELAKVEEEVETLKSVLKSKIAVTHELKRKLGITVWQELSGDLSHGVNKVKESQVYHSVEEKVAHVGKVVSESTVYQTAEQVVKGAAESTRTILGGLTGGFTQKLGQIKNSESFRSLEDRMGSAYENVKSKVSSRSSSIQSFDEAVREEGIRRSPSTIPESKPIS